MALSPGRDAVDLLRAQDDAREPSLVPIRYARMSSSPFAFLRGAAAVMAHDLAAGPVSGLDVQLCGDAHLDNFGMFAAPDRRLVFDLNDFDETHPGPFEWDVKRLAASVVVAARHRGVGDKRARRAAAATVKSYRTTMSSLSRLDPMSLFYVRLEVKTLVDRLRGTPLAGDARRASKDSRNNTGDTAAGKLTEMHDGSRRFRNNPPLLVRLDESVHPGIAADATALFHQYRSSLPADVAVLLMRFGLVGLAHKVVGVGSVGTRAMLLLLEAGDGEPLLLQLKQAGASVLEPYLGPSGYPHGGERVVAGQRLLQAAGDPLLGWATGRAAPQRDYYVRQLRDQKGEFDVDALDADRLEVYGRICGAVLARGHARAGDAAVISGYLGSSTAFDAAVAEFAMRYADVTDTDQAALATTLSRRGDDLTPAVPR